MALTLLLVHCLGNPEYQSPWQSQPSIALLFTHTIALATRKICFCNLDNPLLQQSWKIIASAISAFHVTITTVGSLLTQSCLLIILTIPTMKNVYCVIRKFHPLGYHDNPLLWQSQQSIASAIPVPNPTVHCFCHPNFPQHYHPLGPLRQSWQSTALTILIIYCHAIQQFFKPRIMLPWQL